MRSVLLSVQSCYIEYLKVKRDFYQCEYGGVTCLIGIYICGQHVRFRCHSALICLVSRGRGFVVVPGVVCVLGCTLSDILRCVRLRLVSLCAVCVSHLQLSFAVETPIQVIRDQSYLTNTVCIESQDSDKILYCMQLK